MNRKQRNVGLALLAFCLLLLWLLRIYSGSRFHPVPGSPGPENRFWENPAFVAYSKHARCRMNCRQIDEYEVNEILRKGRLNTSRIRRDERGATYPLEGITRDKQRVRIVVAPRKNGVEVITCIDLDTDWSCDCP